MDMNTSGQAGHYQTCKRVSLTRRVSFYCGTTKRAWDIEGGRNTDGIKVGRLSIATDEMQLNSFNTQVQIYTDR